MVFVSHEDFEGKNQEARVRINGLEHAIRLSSRNGHPHTTETWSDGSLTVVLDYQAGKEKNDSYFVSGTLTVWLNGARKTYPVGGWQSC